MGFRGLSIDIASLNVAAAVALLAANVLATRGGN